MRELEKSITAVRFWNSTCATRCQRWLYVLLCHSEELLSDGFYASPNICSLSLSRCPCRREWMALISAGSLRPARIIYVQTRTRLGDQTSDQAGSVWASCADQSASLLICLLGFLFLKLLGSSHLHSCVSTIGNAWLLFKEIGQVERLARPLH